MRERTVVAIRVRCRGPARLRAVLGVAFVGLTLGVSQVLRPAPARRPLPSSEEIDRARRIVAAQPHPEAILALMGDKHFLFPDRAFAS